jgi:hypothetical protein
MKVEIIGALAGLLLAALTLVLLGAHLGLNHPKARPSASDIQKPAEVSFPCGCGELPRPASGT